MPLVFLKYRKNVRIFSGDVNCIPLLRPSSKMSLIRDPQNPREEATITEGSPKFCKMLLILVG